jgi:hypothetical protein
MTQNKSSFRIKIYILKYGTFLIHPVKRNKEAYSNFLLTSEMRQSLESKRMRLNSL